MIKTRCLVVLETIWGGDGQAPGLFRINPDNHSGKRLIYLLGHRDFWVTNACKEYVANAQQHGKPDSRWLATNLNRLEYDLLLVCGRVAQKTYNRVRSKPHCRTIIAPHPAARTWTKESLILWRDRIQSNLH